MKSSITVLLLSIVSAGCASSSALSSVPMGADSWPSQLKRLVFFPVQATVIVDGTPLPAENSIAVMDFIQKSMEQALETEKSELHTFAALSDAWQTRAREMAVALDQGQPCNLDYILPSLADLVAPLQADAAVLLVAELRLNREAFVSGYGAAAKLLGATAVSTTMLLTQVSAAANGRPLIAIGVRNPRAQTVAMDLEALRFGSTCQEKRFAIANANGPDTTVLGEIDLAATVLDEGGRVLWHRTAHMPLVLAKPSQVSRWLGAFFRGVKTTPGATVAEPSLHF